MNTQQQIRDVLGPADPARNAVVAPSPLSAHDVILRAEGAASPVPGRRRASRRTVLVGAAATVSMVGSAGLAQALRDSPVPAPPMSPQPVDGVVLQPVSYEINAAEPAGPHLRALAARLVDAPYESAVGRYAYHHTRSWSGMGARSPEGHTMSYVYDRRSWTRDDRRWSTAKMLGVEYPDAASREYFSKRRATPAASPSTSRSSGAGGDPREEPRDLRRGVPTDGSGLVRLLRSDRPASYAPQSVYYTFTLYLVPRRVRADILTALADKPGFVWRGRVVDRAGRPGVAITIDATPPAEGRESPQRLQMLLVFDPSTGELLAHEYLELAPRPRVLTYLLFLRTGRTDTLG